MPPTPPEIKYEISAEEVIKAIKGEAFTPQNGLSRVKGIELKGRGIIKDYYLKEEDYVLLEYVKVMGDIVLVNQVAITYNTHVIFYHSEIATFCLQNAQFGEKYFSIINTMIDTFKVVTCQVRSISLENSLMQGFCVSNGSSIKAISLEVNSSVSKFDLCDCYISQFTARNSEISAVTLTEQSTLIIFSLHNSSSGNLQIRGNSKLGECHITNSITQQIIIINSNTGNFIISAKSTTGTIEIQTSETGYFSIRDSKIAGFNIDNSTTDSFFIREGSEIGNFIVGNSATGNFAIQNSTLKSLDIADNCFKIHLDNVTIPITKLHNCTINAFRWQATTKGEVYISQSRINHLNLTNTSILKDALICISDSQIWFAELDKLIVVGQFILNNVSALAMPQFFHSKHQVDAEIIENFNEQLARIQLQSPQATWRIANSSLGKTELTGSDLSRFEFQYKDSKIIESFIAGTTLPKNNIQIYNPTPAEPLSQAAIYEQKTNIYNQLKKIFENQGNVVEGTWYHSKAMENQEKLLALKKPKRWSDEWFDLINFRLNKWSNNHGECWIKAFKFTIITSFIAYTAYYMSIYWHNKIEFAYTGDFFGNFFSFLNPARKEDFMVEKDSINWVAKIFDFVGRVVTGFGIYQIIAAFRRHGKKP